MSLTLVDTNILLDVITEDRDWAEWSLRQLDALARMGALCINDIIYAELSVRFESIEALDARLESNAISLAPMPRAALFLAGKIFQRYRRAGGARTGVLPDFFIGAHAAVMGWTLLTRDARRYRSYFPRLDLVTP